MKMITIYNGLWCGDPNGRIVYRPEPKEDQKEKIEKWCK